MSRKICGARQRYDGAGFSCVRFAGHEGPHAAPGLEWGERRTAAVERPNFPSVGDYNTRRERIAVKLLGAMAAACTVDRKLMDGDEMADDAVHLATKLIARLDKAE